MPTTYYTQSGRPYTIVNGRRKYGAAVAAPRQLTGFGAYKTPEQYAAKKQRKRVAAGAVVTVPRSAAYRLPPAVSEPDPWVEWGSKGGKAVAGFAKGILGLGDYHVKQNVLMGRLPQVVNLPRGGGTIIRFCEYLGDITTSSSANTFAVSSFDINAGLFSTFPWLSQIAQNYEQYSFEGLLFEFRSTSADALNSTNTALGSVIMATNYDSSDPAFLSKGEMLNYEFSTSIKPAESAMHMVECAPRQTVLTELYTRSAAVPAEDDQRFYDLGKFQIATAGFQGTSVVVGELHCTYQVRLLKPKLHQSLGNSISFAQMGNSTGVAAGTPLGTTTGWSSVANVQTLAIVFTSSTVITFPVTNVIQQYLLRYGIQGTIAGALVYPVLTAANMTIGTGTLQTATFPVAATAATSGVMHVWLKTTPNGLAPTLTFGVGGTFPTGTVVCAIGITQVPDAVTIT